MNRIKSFHWRTNYVFSVKIVKIILLFSHIILISSCDNEIEITPPGGSEILPEKVQNLVEINLFGDSYIFEKTDSNYIFQKDIILTQEQIQKAQKKATGLFSLAKRWENNTVFFEISPDLDTIISQRIINAILHWEERTNLTFQPRINELNFIEFIPTERNCWSNLGMIGGRQEIGLSNECTEGNIIHEIGHAIGLFHEQSRADRDNHIVIHWDNIEEGSEHNFRKYSSRLDGFDYDSFDFSSIMLYGPFFFSANNEPTITKLDGSIYNFQRDSLSINDVKVANYMHPPPAITANFNEFIGKWYNENEVTDGISRLEISNFDPSKLLVHVWASCGSSECDWGNTKVSIRKINNSEIRMLWNHKFALKNQILSLLADGRLRMITSTVYIDGSKRQSFTTTYIFNKEELQPPRLEEIEEDCIDFNPQIITLVPLLSNGRFTGRFGIKEGKRVLFKFPNAKEAKKAYEIIKHYEITKYCFVERPYPSFTYLLTENNSPEGPFSEEDCIRFNPENISVQNVEGRWKILDGNHWIFDFSNNEEEARKAFKIIKKHGFSHTCYVGRPQPSLEYLRK